LGPRLAVSIARVDEHAYRWRWFRKCCQKVCPEICAKRIKPIRYTQSY
jgi:hypothetical protein